MHPLATLAFLESSWFVYSSEVAAIAVKILALLTVPSVLRWRRGRPHAALGWIVTLLTIPALAIFLWWALGRDHMRRKRRRKQAARRTVGKELEGVRAYLPTPAVGARFLPFRKLPANPSYSVFPPTTHNRLALLARSSDAYDSLEETIRAAKHHVHFQFYIWQTDATGKRFRDLLAEKARQGVEVRALYDTMGSLWAHGRFFQPLRDAGAQVAAFLPPRLGLRNLTLNFRNHRKIVVVDGRVGFTGSLNIGDEYLGDWHDVAVRIEGPAVAQLQEVFCDDWYFAAKENLAAARYFEPAMRAGDELRDENPGDDSGGSVELIASGPDNMPSNPTRDAFFLALITAKERIRLMSPYFVPDDAIVTALRAGTLRGVDIQLLLPAKSDVPLARFASRSYYLDLLRAGVRIYEYQPGFLHAKILVVDDAFCAVGSANVDNRSFRLNFEATVFVDDATFVADVVHLFEADLAKSAPIHFQDLPPSTSVRAYLNAAAHLVGPLL